MDIKGACPSVERGRLGHAMKSKGIDGNHMKWTVSVITGRTIEMVIEGNVMQIHPVEAHIPQGWPRSPILFVIYTSGLINWVKDRVLGAETYSLVEHVGWVATGGDVNEVVTDWSVPKTVWAPRGRHMRVVQRGSSTDAGASLPPLQPKERPAEDTVEDSGKGHRLESGEMPTCADF